MTFTDEDLKRLKEAMDTPSLRACRAFGVPDLLARLKAAELAISNLVGTCCFANKCSHEETKTLAEWRKVAGK